MNQLTGEYLQAYEKVEAMCQNLSFFMNDDEYFQITILEEVLDLLVEAQANHQSVEFVLGNDYQQFIQERYKECSRYDFSYGTMAIMFIIVYLSLTAIFPHLFRTHRMETEYYMFLLFPILAHIFYSLNQAILIKIFYKCSQQFINIVKNIFACIGIGFLLLVIMFAGYLESHTIAIWLFIMYLGVSRKTGRIINKQTISIYTFFIIEMGLVIFGFGLLSQYIRPLHTTGSFQWFIPVVLCVICLKLPFQSYSLKMILMKQDEEEIYDHYLSHCHFLKVKRKMMKDIPLTNQAYFVRQGKRNKIYQKLLPFVCFGLLISLGMFISEFQMSVFYLIIITYGLFGMIYFYKFMRLTNKISRICEENL